MRAIILLACLLAVAISSPLNTYADGTLIKFEQEVHEGSPIGIYYEGQIDPRDEKMNKITAFLRLANKYIPILESLAGKETGLKYERTYRFAFLGAVVDVYTYFQLIVGWKVSPGGYTTDRFDVTYTPFVWGGTLLRFNGTSILAMGSTEMGLQYVLAYTPISLQLYRAGKICFQGSYRVEAVNFLHKLYAALTECHDEVLDDIIVQHIVLNFTCSAVRPVNITLYNINFTNAIAGDFVPQTCINF